MKIAVVTPIPTPYRDAFWNAVDKREGIDLTVFYCAATKSDRPWSGDWERDYDWEVLPGKNLLAWKSLDASLYYNPAIITRLKEGKFDAVLIGGYNHLTMLLAVWYCIRQKTPYFLMCESNLSRRRSTWRKMAKDWLVRWVVSNMAGGFPTGTLAEQYLVHYGAHPKTLTFLPNVPDVEKIQQVAESLRNNREQLRTELCLSSNPTLLFVGRLIPKKGAHLIIDTMAELRDKVTLDLVIVGDGSERAQLEQQADDRGLKHNVRFAGFAEPQDIIRWYAAADLFVLPSSETWGVVVLEALAAGLPVVVSEQVGCHPDIVAGLPVGKVVTHGQTSELADAFRELLEQGKGADEISTHWQPIFNSLRFGALAKAIETRIQSGGVPAHNAQKLAAQ